MSDMEEPSPAPPEVQTRKLRPRGVPVAGIAILAAGVLLLLQTTGVAPWGVWGELLRFWPVALIAAGVHLVLGKRLPVLTGTVIFALLAAAIGGAVALAGDANMQTVTSSFQAPLEETEVVDVSLTFAAGTLRLYALPEESPLLADGQFETPGRQPSIVLERSGNNADFRFSMETGQWFGGFGGEFRNAEWDIALSRMPDLRVEVDGGAADLDLDLRQLHVSRLDLNIGAADVNVRLPEQAGQTEVTIESGASSIEVRVPEGVAARITSSSGLSSVDVDESRFPHVNGAWESADYDTAENRALIQIRVGVASVNVR
ncbi:MAG: DUF5668 domain-containing protein [Dehalococcoidia bacterium]